MNIEDKIENLGEVVIEFRSGLKSIRKLIREQKKARRSLERCHHSNKVTVSFSNAFILLNLTFKVLKTF